MNGFFPIAQVSPSVQFPCFSLLIEGAVLTVQNRGPKPPTTVLALLTPSGLPPLELASRNTGGSGGCVCVSCQPF